MVIGTGGSFILHKVSIFIHHSREHYAMKKVWDAIHEYQNIKGRYTLPVRTGRKKRPYVRPVEDTRTIPEARFT